MLTKLFYCLLIPFLLVYAAEYDYTVEVPAGKMSCFFQPVQDPKYKNMEIDYQVIDGGDLNINFLLVFGSNILAQDKMKTDNSHRIDINSKGDFQICFDNTFAYQDRKVVFFEIFLYDQDGNLDEDDFSEMADNRQLEQMEVQLEEFKSTSMRLKVNLNKAEHYQALLRAWEARDRAVMEANYTRVNFWSIVNAIVLVSVGVLQVYMIRQLFEDNSRVGKIMRRT